MTETTETPAGVEFVRTPDDRFIGLDDFPHQPRYIDVELRSIVADIEPIDDPCPASE